MKFSNLFHLVEDAQEISSMFESVETPDQMVSALERLKKHPSEVLEIVQSLRLSTEAVLEDVIEPGGVVGGDIPDDFEDNLLEEISNDNEGVGKNEKAPETAQTGK